MTTIKTTPFDPVRHFKSSEAQRELLEDALLSGDNAYITDALGIIAQALGMTEVAHASGMTRCEGEL